jgi:tellurite methyltransferase
VLEPLPKRRHLDPRPESEAQQAPIVDSVNIPLDDLPARVAELPPKQEMISVAGPEQLARRTVAQLQSTGRRAELAPDWRYGENHGTGRLWEPNPWLAECIASLTPESAIDLGCGSGRDAVYLAAQGWHVQAVDILPDAIQLGRNLAARCLDARTQDCIDWQVADLLDSEYKFPSGFDLIFSAFFFDRALTSQAIACLNFGGSLILEAFTTVHQVNHGKPASSLRVIKPGEMAGLLKDLDIIELHEGEHNGRHTTRVWARKGLA